MTVLADGTAELVLVISEEDRQELAEEGILAIKPIKLTRTR